jgi:biotin carboxyl carrier protein
MRFKHRSGIRSVIRRSEGVYEIDGDRVEATVAPVAGARFHGRTESGWARVFVARDGDRVFARVGDREYDLTVMGRLAASEAHSMAEGVLETPMPGRVTRVAVIAGDPVKRGQELIVIEAMKMENALVAPMDGVVKSVAVKAGDMVAPGSALVVVEAGP